MPADPRIAPRRIVETLWFAATPLARLTRLTLAPAAAAFAAVAESRRRLYDHGVLRTHRSAVPVISVGNLTVGGTGKTPLAAWLAGTLRARGHRPGIVLRGYGAGDEVAVHRVLSPGVPVVANPDRLAGVRAVAELGCDYAVLDDAFQHRRVARALDLALINADQWRRIRWPLPAGPWREPLGAVARATIAIISRKTADATAVSLVRAAVHRAAPEVPVAVMALLPAAVRTLAGETRALAWLRGMPVRAIAGIASPESFFAQLAGLGARVDGLAFPDHHRYNAADVDRIMRATPRGSVAVCTLKDAVKLVDLWPREAEPLWYVSQQVEFESGIEALYAAIDALGRVGPALD